MHTSVISQFEVETSEIEGSPGPRCLWSLWRRVLPAFSRFLVAASSPWRFLVMTSSLQSLPVITCCSFFLCTCPSPNFSLLKRTPTIGFRAHSPPIWPRLTCLHPNCLFPNKITFIGTGGLGLQCIFCPQNPLLDIGSFPSRKHLQRICGKLKAQPPVP